MLKRSRIFSLLFVCLYLFALNGSAHAEDITTLSLHKVVFENTNCAENGTCSLKRVRYLAEDYRVGVGDEYNYGTSLAAWYTTESLESLRDYVFVQFIRGCVYTTEKDERGLVQTGYTIVREFFGGEFIRFCHDDWEIDTTDKSPVYWSTPNTVRQYGYAWNTTPDSIERETARAYGVQLPPTPELYVTDLPAQAFYLGKTAYNVSLDFRMCIYKERDVPLAVSSPREINFAIPIHCFAWKSSFIFDHERGEYKMSLNGSR